MLADRVPRAWRRALADELEAPYLAELDRFVERERERYVVFPPREDELTALRLTPPDEVRVVLLGQDPYHGPGQAHGLAFSVHPGVRPPPSLGNVFRELTADLGCSRPTHGHLASWARQGVLLLNAVLTVRKGEPNSHRGKGWERFTDAVLAAVAARPQPVVFLLWGAYAQKKAALIEGTRHVVLAAPHPSPLSARKGFFGSRPFSRANAALRGMGADPVGWCLPPEPTAEG